jgi:hypothetical protein
VILKTGEATTIVEVYEQGIACKANIRDGDDYRTQLIAESGVYATGPTGARTDIKTESGITFFSEKL